MNRLHAASLLIACLAFSASGLAQPPHYEPISTILADFETDSVAASLVDARNVPAADCRVKRVPIPARGQTALMIEIGAIAPNASVACELAYRVDTPIDEPLRAAVFCWLNEGQAAVAFRVRDARGRIFETSPQAVGQTRRWQLLSASLGPEGLAPVPQPAERDAAPAAERPLEIVGLRVTTPTVGHQAIFVDDVQVEHLAPLDELVRAEFRFDELTRLYVPGAVVSAEVEFENRSRSRPCELSVELTWHDERGQTVGRGSGRAVLPPSSPDFRSRQRVNASQRFSEPGLYRLSARVRNDQSPRVREFSSSLAVIHSNRLLSRGRNVFFALRSNLLREARPDRAGEIRAAREIGAQLLALDVAWDLLEPSPGQYRLDELDDVLNALAERDFAVMLSLAHAPSWMPDAAARRAPQRRLLAEMARRAAAKAAYFQPLEFERAGVAPGDEPAYLSELAAALREAGSRATLVAPPVRVDEPAPRPLPRRWSDAPAIWTFQTEGRCAPAREALRRYAAANGLTWSSATWWQHRAAPLPSAGVEADAVELLEHYVEAARAGVGSLAWSDLRDDSSDPRRPEQQRGLLGRDFGPKRPLIAYSSLAGALSGMRYVHPTPGTPSAFDSALFIASNRQTAVVIPRGNRIRPAVLAPVSGLGGALSVVDFQRRPLPVLESAGPTLVPTHGGPFFVAIEFEQIEPKPRLEFATEWLRVPATLLCGEDTATVIELDAPLALQRSYLQIVLPPDAPFTSSVGARNLRAAAGDTIRIEPVFTPVAGRAFERSLLTVRLALEGRVIELPLVVRRLHQIASLGDGPATGVLSLTTDAGAAPAGEVRAACTPDELSISVRLAEPPGPEDELRIAVARLGQAGYAEQVIRPAAGRGVEASPPGWTCESVRDERHVTCRVRVRAEALGVSALTANEIVLAAARLTRRSAANVTAVYAWGGGIDTGSPEEFCWLRPAP
ncbi:MAG: beta-galactosidase [Phycisphaerae bacterium]|nr:beta-galactosidase [Phycisphaerae bacterium]MCZ2398770.1 beta-galactosidase [Phycisphaerae bacterium]